MRQITIGIDGMSCGGCARAVAKAINALPGAHVDAVAVGSATVRYDPSRTTPEVIGQAIRAAGYRPAAGAAPTAAPGPVASSGGCCGGGASGAAVADHR